jgi:uncharacterized spore protein YtfJ
MADIVTPGQKPQDSKQLDPNRGLDTIQTTMDKFLSAADVEAVYGPPVSHGENIVITAAEVLSIAGFGLGSGSGSPGGDHPEQTGSGSGGGGGGRVLARPVATIVMSPTGVRIEPILDVTKIVLAALTTAGFMVAMLNQMRSKKPPKLDV